MNDQVFSDSFVAGIGQTLLKYFEYKEFPQELLQYPVLNMLYTKVQINKAVNDQALSDAECYARIDSIFDASNKRKPKPCSKLE